MCVPMEGRGSENTNIERVTVGGKNLEKTTVGLTGRLFRAPEPLSAAPVLMAVSALMGLLMLFDPGDPASSFTPASLHDSILLMGVLQFLVPALLAAVVAPPVIALQGGSMPWRRSFTLSVINLGVMALVLALGGLVGAFMEVDVVLVMVLALTGTALTWHIAMVSVVFGDRLRALPASLIHYAAGIAAVFALGHMGLWELRYYHPYAMVIYPAVFMIVSALWFQIGQRAFRIVMGRPGLDVLRHAVAEFTQTGSGRAGLESFYDSVGTTMDMEVGGVLFTRSAGEGPGGGRRRHKLFMGVSDAHPGPFGATGGADISGALDGALRPRVPNTMLFHGASTHDENPTTRREVDRIVGGFRSLVRDLERRRPAPRGGNGPFVRLSRELDVCGQQLGGGLVLLHTSAPAPTDDVEPAVGRALGRAARGAGWNSVLFFDAHNCLKVGAGGVYQGSRKARALRTLGEKVAKKLRTDDGGGSGSGSVEIGYADRRGFDPSRDAIGTTGVQLAAVRTGGMTVGYLLVDGNNMVCGLRGTLREIMLGSGFDEAEVLTTDSHLVNARIGGYNPVGSHRGTLDLPALVTELGREALADLEPCTARAGVRTVEEVRIFGEGTAVKVSLAIHHSLDPMGKAFGPMVVAGAFACGIITLLL